MGKGIIMASAEACQKKCANSAGCMRFSFWPDGRCLLTDVESEPQASPHTISGPALCPEHLGEEPTVQTGARLRGQRGDAGGFDPDGPWQDYHPYDPPDNDGLSRRLGSGLRHLQESKSPTPETQKVPSEATAKTGAAHPSGQNNDDEGFGPNGPWQDYDPYDPPDNDGLSRHLGSGLRHLQESKSPTPETQKVPSEATAKTGAAHPSGRDNDDEGFGPNGPWQDYDPYDPPDNDGLSRRLGSGLRHLQESKSPAPEAQKVPSDVTAKTGAVHSGGQNNDDEGFGPNGPWQDYDPYDPPDNDGLSRRLGSGLRHLQESKSPAPEAQKVPSEATAKTGAAHPAGQNNDDEGFGPDGPWQDYDPYDPPDNDGLSRRLGSGLRHLQESKSPTPEAQKVPSEATAKTGAAHPSGQNNDDEGFGPNGPWQDYDPYDPPDNDGLSRRLGSGLRHLQESKSPTPEAQKVPSEATAKTGAAHPAGQNNDDEGFGPNGPWQDYDPYDPPDNDGLSRRLGSGLRHLQESKSPAPEAQKVPSDVTAKTGAVHSGGQNNDDEGFGPNGPWQDYDPYDPPDNDGLSRRLGSGLRHLQESKSPAPEAQKVPSEAAVTKEAMMASRGVRPI